MKKTHVVHFELNGGSPDLEDLVVENNKKIETPLANKPSCTFMGWYIDKKLTNKFDDNTRINEDLTLYAGWGYYVSLGGKEKSSGKIVGGYVGIDKEYGRLVSCPVLDGKKVTLSVRPDNGYDFIGWADGDKIINNDKKYKVVVDKRVELTAYFEKK